MKSSQRAILEVLIGILGFALFLYETNLMEAAGLYLILFANNIGHSRRVV
jgi:hypothetical protein